MGDCKLAALNKFYLGHLGGETGLLSTRFCFRNFSVSDERGSVINDYL